MKLDTSTTPWAHDELQLIGAELGDTIEMANENDEAQIGLIVSLTKMAIFVLTEGNEILKFGRVSLSSVDGKWDMVGLSEKEMRITRDKWTEVKNRIKTKADKKKGKA
jgi:hypothetical protein